MFVLIMLNALLASTFTLGKVVLDYTKPIFFVGISMFLGGCILCVYQLVKAPARLKIASGDMSEFLQVSIFSIFLSYSLYFWGLNYLPSFKACLFYNLGPVASYLIGYFVFQESMMIKKWIGLMVGLLGMLPMLFFAMPAKQPLCSLCSVSLPELAVIASVAMYSYGWFIVRRLVHVKQYSPLTVNGVSMITGGLLSLASVPLVEGTVEIKAFPPFFFLLAATILIEYIICNHLYAILLRRYSETFLSFSSYLIPFFGALYGWFFLDESITSHFFLRCFILSIPLKCVKIKLFLL